jgi:gamma-glutamylaminecyclotransferase
MNSSVKETTILFVYGTLKRGFENHPIVEESRFIGTARSVQPMAMWGIEFPYVSDKLPLYPIFGEVYEVSEAVLRLTDALEDHPRLYQRSVRDFSLVGGNVIAAWIYLSHAQLRSKPLESGEWK